MSVCADLHRLLSGLGRFRFPFDRTLVPRNGVYVFFERGEAAHGVDRVVRVGAHRGQDQLRGRLAEHFIKENKDRSIFRKNVGRALLNRANDPFLDHWNLDMLSRAAREKYAGAVDQERRRQVEAQVTQHIQSNCSFVVFEVAELSSRLPLESKVIATVASCQECGPSPEWLGLSSPDPKIRESGLWQVQKLAAEQFTEEEFTDLAKILKTE
jgi:hypothetical protein